MEQENLLPKSYTPDLELKSEIVYESLCENYGKTLIDDILEVLSIEKIDLSDDQISGKILNILNGGI